MPCNALGLEQSDVLDSEQGPLSPLYLQLFPYQRTSRDRGETRHWDRSGDRRTIVYRWEKNEKMRLGVWCESKSLGFPALHIILEGFLFFMLYYSSYLWPSLGFPTSVVSRWYYIRASRCIPVIRRCVMYIFVRFPPFASFRPIFNPARVERPARASEFVLFHVIRV